MGTSFADWRKQVKSADNIRREASFRHDQHELFPVEISTRYPDSPVGQDLAFRCTSVDGDHYYAKQDKDNRCIRATEWIATRVADALGISVADSAVLKDSEGETYFGSRQPTSLADEILCQRFLRTPPVDEIGRPAPWLGRYLAKVWAFDLFIDNPDRNLKNFILEGSARRIRAIDFASARYIQKPDTKFPIASDHTGVVGSAVRRMHGVHRESAFELLDWLGAMSMGTITTILNGMPDEWFSEEQRGGFIDAWSEGKRRNRINGVKALIEHDWQV